MRKIYLILAAIIALNINATAQKQSRQIDTLMSYYNQLLEFNGNVLVAKKGDVIFHKGYGYRIVDKEMVCDTNTYFQVGELTQTFTATMVLMLHEQKKLNIEDKLSKYFPDFPRGNEITIEHLLTHTSGIYDYRDSVDFIQSHLMSAAKEGELLAVFNTKPLLFKPGSQYSMSNSNYILLGHIIEQVTKQSYYDAAKTMIFDTLGMTHVGFAYNLFPSWDKATGHYIIRYGRLMPAPIVDSTVTYASGALYTTAGDLYKWADAVMNKRLLSPKMWQKAWTPYKGDFGYGWRITTDTAINKKVVGSSGIILGFISDLQLIPEDTSAIILLSNDMGDDHEQPLKAIRAILYDAPFDYPQPKQPLNLGEEKLREYEGMYALSKTTNLRIYYEQNVIKGLILGQDPFTLFAEGNDTFFMANVDTKIYFTRDENGRVISLTIKNQGQTQTAERWR